MKHFTQLFQAIDATTSTNEKVKALQEYFQTESSANAVWALYLLLGKTRRRLITARTLREIFLQVSDIPEWLFEESHAHVGDSAETIALLLRDTPIEPTGASSATSDTPLKVWMEEIIPQVKPLQKAEGDQLKNLVIDWWANLSQGEIFVLNKVLTGAFRVGVSTKLVIKALATEYDLTEAVLAHRLMGDIEPTAGFYEALVNADDADTQPSQPYPFFLASPIDVEKFSASLADPLSDSSRWQVEWKWDGIRAQLIHRAQQVFIWSRGEDLVTHQFPELEAAAAYLPEGTVLDGEIICWDGRSVSDDLTIRPLDFNYLQKRLGRKRVGKKLMAENPVYFIAYDLLEKDGEDMREKTLRSRRTFLAQLIDSCIKNDSDTAAKNRITLAQPLSFETFEDIQRWRSRSRQYGAEGLMLKALESPYLVGRKRGYWWKHKVDPMTLDAVLIYAQAGTGKRANLFTDYTFALWKGDTLVPFTKAYSGLDNKEIEKLDRWIRRHTVEKFGPVRSVEPLHVFEIGFEGIAESKRHKSGIAVRFPRILRWREDKPAAEADTLDNAIALLDSYTPSETSSEY
ncbi:MAG: ATP-dependent DNA ligase [Phormidesmis sp.]